MQVGVVVVDGTRIAASAADRQTRCYGQVAKEILGEAAAIDAAGDELYGAARGDELPPGFRNHGERRTRPREAKQALEAKRAAQAKPVARDRSQRLHECRRRLREEWAPQRRVLVDHAAWLEAGIASDGSRPTGKINLSDPDARTLKAPRGRLLGYDAQAVVAASQIIVAAEVNTESIDKPNLQPMVDAACDELRVVAFTLGDAARRNALRDTHHEMRKRRMLRRSTIRTWVRMVVSARARFRVGEIPWPAKQP